MAFSLKRLVGGLSKTRENLASRIRSAVGLRKKIDRELLDEIEEILISADVSVETTQTVIDRLQQKVAEQGSEDAGSVFDLLRECLVEIFGACADGSFFDFSSKPYVLMIVGVNGTGKTTSIAKMAHRLRQGGMRVTLAAADTFRAAAIDQLTIWAERVGCDIVSGQEGGDSAAVAFDSVNAAIARNHDAVIVDTAGRLHTKSNLMQELAKVKRVIGKALANAPHRTLLVLDGTTGQNALQQVEVFNQTLALDGIIVTKLDGTAKGGVVFSIVDKYKLPVVLIGIGEKMDDLDEFRPADFVEALFA